MANFNVVQFVKTAARNSPWLVIAVAIHVVVVAIMATVYLTGHREQEKDSSTSVTIANHEALPDVEQPPEIIDRKAVPKNEEAEIVDYEHEQVYIPTSEPEDLTKEVGDPTADPSDSSGGTTGGTAIGVGEGPGHYGTGRPNAFSGRRLGTGGRHGRPPLGVTQSTEKAVREGLNWLIRHQKEDGSWSATVFPDACVKDVKGHSPCFAQGAQAIDARWDEGLTGLALLAFLGAGYNFDSKQLIVDTVRGKKARIGDVVRNGLMWLKKRQQEDGSFSGLEQHMYNQTLATLALTEAYGLSQNRVWKEPAQRAVDYLVAAQKQNPYGEGLWGWRYHSLAKIEAKKAELSPESYHFNLQDADTSVTTWVVMAFKSAELAGLKVPPEAYAGARAYVQWVTGSNGLVGYL